MRVSVFPDSNAAFARLSIESDSCRTPSTYGVIVIVDVVRDDAPNVSVAYTDTTKVLFSP